MPAVIFSVDEGFFAAFSPKQLKKTLAELEELPGLPRSPSFRGLDAPTVLRLVVALVAVFGAVQLLIVPQTRTLKDAGDALCGNETHTTQPPPRSLRFRKKPTQSPGFGHTAQLPVAACV